MRHLLDQETFSELDGYSGRRTKTVFVFAAVSLVIIYTLAVAVSQSGAFSTTVGDTGKTDDSRSNSVEQTMQTPAAEHDPLTLGFVATEPASIPVSQAESARR